MTAVPMVSTTTKMARTPKTAARSWMSVAVSLLVSCQVSLTCGWASANDSAWSGSASRSSSEYPPSSMAVPSRAAVAGLTHTQAG
jgi:hypothetical protein